MNTIYTLFFLMVFLYFTRCTTDVAGTISETDTGCAVAGVVKDNLGNTVHGAVVIIHDLRNVLSSAACEQQSVESLQLSDTTVTDQNGHFTFDSVDTGNFLIEVIHLNSFGGITPISIGLTDTLIETRSVVKPDGSITGKIDTTIAVSTKKIAIVIQELGKTVQVDSSGAFSFGNLPEWQYHLSIAHDILIDTFVGATALIPVVTGSTSRVSGLGSPTGMTVIVDSAVLVNEHINTDSGLGGGIAFLENDSVLKLRLLTGQKNRYYQVDVQIDRYKADTAGVSRPNIIPELTGNNSQISVLNGDSLLFEFSILNSSSNLLYNVNADTSSISGTIVIEGVPVNSSYPPVKISGSFTADIGPEREGSWDCDFGDTICSCWFF